LCGSGKKYKNYYLKNSEAINIGNFKYDKYLEVRNSACSKIFLIGNKELGIEKDEATYYLLDFLLSPVDYDRIEGIENFDIFLDDISFLFTIFGYPIHDLIESGRDLDDFGFDIGNIEDNYLWKYCYTNFISEFTKEEEKFIGSLKESRAGFFKIINIDSQKSDFKKIALDWWEKIIMIG